MKIIFEKGDKVNVKGYRSEGVVNVTFTTESRDFGFDIVRVQMGGIELTVPSDEVTAVAAPVEAATVEESAPVELVKHVSSVVSSRPMTEAEKRSGGRPSRYLSVGVNRCTYGKTIPLS